MTVDLGWGAAPYNYSDMTGSVVLGTAKQGTWSVVHDSGYSGTVWNTVSWNSDEPEGTRIKVEARAANKESRLSAKTWTEVSNGTALSNIIGQYLEIRANFIRDSDVKESPVLYDLTVTYPDPPPTPVLNVETPTVAYQSCYESITVSGAAYDKLGIASLSVNGKPVIFTPTNNPDTEKPNEVSFNTTLSANIGSNIVSIVVANTSGKTDSETRIVRRLPVIECACTPVLKVENPKAGYLSSDYYTCNESITVSGTATDCEGVKSIIVNGSLANFISTDNPDKQNEVSFNIPIYLNLEDNTIDVTVTNTFGKTAFVKRSVYRFEGGVFIAGDDGIVKFDWLYDGGAYKGEMGIFSLSNMETLIPNSPEFIREAARRVLSNSEQGYVVISDRTEGARFSGFIGENQEWNSGTYNGVKSFKMKPGDTFAIILVPNYTLQELIIDPATSDVQKCPLFSLASANPEHNLYVGQIADVNGMGKAFIYEDKNFVSSDRDYNDFIFQITGVVVCEGKTPTIDSLIKEGIMKPERDWRIFTQIGKEVIEHIESPDITEDTVWVSVTAKPGANITVYDVNGKFIGKDGGQIPGATIETDENGNQIIKIPQLQIGDYRIVVQATGSDGKGELEIRGFKGDTEFSVQALPFTFEQGQTLSAYLPVKNFLETGVFEIKDLKIPTLDGKPLIYDFDADGDIDVSDIMKVASKWNTKTGDADYDAFYDFNKDGQIGLLDVMMVVNSLN